MPSTYSPNLRLTLQATGENTNTWGTINNSVLGTLIEQAISGVGAVALPDANYTLTALDGSSDESRNAVLVFTGALTAQRAVTVPSVQKAYTVVNATTGGQEVVVKTGAGAGVTIAAGSVALVYCDGTDVLAASPNYNPTSGAIVVKSLVPTGMIMPYAGGGSGPSGGEWLFCYGQAVSRTTYAALFAVIGVTYGPGNGTTTFNVPDLRGRAVAGLDNMGGVAASRLPAATAAGWSGGAATHQLVTGEIPSHTHTASTASNGTHTHTASTDSAGSHQHTLQQQVLTAGGSGVQTSFSTNFGGALPTTDVQGSHTHTVTVDSAGAHTHGVTVDAAGGGGAHNNVQPTLALNYLIKT